MRLQGQAKGGYYPLHPEAVKFFGRFIDSNPKANILDPCAGCGVALEALADMLEIAPAQRHAIEIEAARSEELEARFPAGKVLGHASFFGTAISPKSFSMIYANPPYDDGDSGRMEVHFTSRATELLMPGGVLMLILPESQVDNWELKRHMTAWYESALIVRAPAEYREYGETCITAVKRKAYYDQYVNQRTFFKEFGGEDVSYQLPNAGRILQFRKSDPTPEELREMVKNSHLMRIFEEPRKVRTTPTPPMSLGKGHLAMMLAAGHLNGVVEHEGELPHVVRGTSIKKEQLAKSEVIKTEDSVKIKTEYHENIRMVIRTLHADGTINDLDGGNDDEIIVDDEQD